MIFIMAWRNIWRNKMRSIIIMSSIAIGLFAGISVLALYKGMMKSRIRNVIDSEVGHLQIHNIDFKKDYDPQFILANGAEVLKSVRDIPEVKLAASRSITMGMLATPTGSAGVQINGISPDLEYQLSQLEKKIIQGKPFDPKKKNEIMVGRKLAQKMKLKLRSKLVLTFTDTSGNMVSGAFRVNAIYQSDNAPLDEKNIYVGIGELNTLLGIQNAFHEIVILLKRDADVKKVQQQLQQKFPACQIESWKEISPETDLLVKTVDQYSYIIMFIIMFSLAFGIVNTMLMAILERTREIGMMVALGTNHVRIFLMIFLETIFLTLGGMPVGLFIAWLATAYFNKHGLDLSGMGREMMSSFGFGTMIYPEFPTDKVIGVLLIVAGTAFVSCLLPAIKALKLRPVEALRR
ncbi:ABC-type lipoprotein release transport system permease subunit [Chitinophaga polysaccharea]|uniref:ABC-type lipoprotein release transport system permease subunit n=1 Tax=Chitinophaga polysaccharea TaxID=1293035 RepID=A0A561PA79_9BACT|nr:FtsX-like permease family protein [Chitinophaga polysaccharea]TWF34970.1 ABC-type lipoprotein release transport system permease subunit [Chitinophaga polysaccharea]